MLAIVRIKNNTWRNLETDLRCYERLEFVSLLKAAVLTKTSKKFK